MKLFSYAVWNLLTTKATMITKITAPKIDGTIAIPATCGPHSPRRACPNEEPIKPAKILAIQFIDLP